MYFQRLTLVNFKNYSSAEITFDPQLNAFVGGNGEGKTNLLDAIHYLSLCKSYFNPIDGQNIRQGEDMFVIQASVVIDELPDTLSCGIRRGQKKVFRRGQKEYDRLADHIGIVPVVMISPTDSVLITGGSEERRKFMDSIISQFDRNYLEHLIAYTRILTQRNSFLRQGRISDADTLGVWDEQLVHYGEKLHAARCEFIDGFIPVFQKYFAFITGEREDVGLRYESHLHRRDFREQLCEALEKDLHLQYTSVGPHKDDLVFMVQELPAKRFASQGQQKSFLIALKLAQFDYICRLRKIKPVLLLDDIFDKLDDKRVARLMELVSSDSFGQIFITDSHPDRLRKVFGDIGMSIRTFNIDRGTVCPSDDSTPVSRQIEIA